MGGWNKGMKGYSNAGTYKKGHAVALEVRKKIVAHRVGKIGIKANAWKGDNAGYRALHEWVKSRLGKATECSKDPTHKSTVYYWANKSGQYKRVLSDWHQLCPSCNKLDGIKVHQRFIVNGEINEGSIVFPR